MKTFSILALVAGLVPCLILPVELRGQTAEQPPAEPPVQRAVISLNFTGGTVAEYVEAVIKTAKDINIVVMPEAREFEVPPLTLTAVDVGSAMQLLDARTAQQGRGLVELSVQEIEPFQGNGRAIYTISAQRGGPPDSELPEEAGVWTIAELLGANMKAEDILTAIQTAVDLIADRYGPAEIRFHEATGLIIGRGQVQQMHTVEQVIDRLRKGIAGSRKARSADQSGKDSASRSTADWQAALDSLKTENQSLADRLAAAEQRVAELQHEMSAKPK